MNRYFTITSIILLLAVSATTSVAQQLVARVHTGYTFGSRFTIDGGRARINDGAMWAGSMAYFFDDYKGAELYYNYQNTLLSARSVLIQGGKFEEQLNIHYIMAGVAGKRPTSLKTDLMGGMKIGAVIFDPVQRSFTSITRMAVGFNGGFNYYFSEKVGINAGFNLLMPIFDVGGFIWWSPGSGIDVGLASTTPFVQFSFVTGLSFRL